jgi:integrase
VAFKSVPLDDEETIRKRRGSANRIARVLRAALNHAYVEHKVNSNAAWGKRFRAFKGVDQANQRYLSLQECNRLLNACDSTEFRLLVRAALETGARYGELCRLKVADFNPDAKTLTIRRSKTFRSRHIVLTPKGATFFAGVCAGRLERQGCWSSPTARIGARPIR